jgi:hypothetical protein
VWVKPGSGKITVNGKDVGAYFARPVLQMILKQPFQIANVVSAILWVPALLLPGYLAARSVGGVQITEMHLLAVAGIVARPVCASNKAPVTSSTYWWIAAFVVK